MSIKLLFTLMEGDGSCEPYWGAHGLVTERRTEICIDASGTIANPHRIELSGHLYEVLCGREHLHSIVTSL